MSSLFKRPKTPDAPPPPKPADPPPTITTDNVAVQTDERDRVRKRRGRAATMLTEGNVAPAAVGAKTLLGS